MAAIIQKQEAKNTRALVAQVDERLLDRLRAFANYVNLPAAAVVEQAIDHVMRADKEFTAKYKAGEFDVQPVTRLKKAAKAS